MDFVDPKTFAARVRELWSAPVDVGVEPAVIEESSSSAAWLALEDLEPVITACYQASLQREEARQVNFRLILGPPSTFDGTEAYDYLVLPFERPRPFSDHELRRLAPAVDFYRGLIGVNRAADGGLEIWGLIHSGPEWIQAITGGRGHFVPLPHWPVISVLGPGWLAAARGSFTLGLLRAGHFIRPKLDVFESPWLPGSFGTARDEVLALHLERVGRRGGCRNTMDPSLIKILGQQCVRRMISLVRHTRHGGTLLFLPLGLDDPRQLRIKYRFSKDERRLRFRWAVLDIFEYLACDYVPPKPFTRPIDWEIYKQIDDGKLAALDRKIFEFAHFVSEVAGADGAVVLDKRFEIFGFGAEIAVSAEVEVIQRALDTAGRKTVPVATESFGTRHRSAFRYCAVQPEALAVVISQDGTVSFVKSYEGKVTYWDQIAVSVLDI